MKLVIGRDRFSYQDNVNLIAMLLMRNAETNNDLLLSLMNILMMYYCDNERRRRWWHIILWFSISIQLKKMFTYIIIALISVIKRCLSWFNNKTERARQRAKYFLIFWKIGCSHEWGASSGRCCWEVAPRVDYLIKGNEKNYLNIHISSHMFWLEDMSYPQWWRSRCR